MLNSRQLSLKLLITPCTSVESLLIEVPSLIWPVVISPERRVDAPKDSVTLENPAQGLAKFKRHLAKLKTGPYPTNETCFLHQRLQDLTSLSFVHNLIIGCHHVLFARQAQEDGAQPDVWKVEILKISKAILECLEEQNVSK